MARGRVRSWLRGRPRGLQGRDPVYPTDNPDVTEITRVNFEHSHRVGWPYGPPDTETMRKAGMETES